MKNIPIIALLAGIVSSCSGQIDKEKVLAQNDTEQLNEEPKGNWTVNKEVDENGNIVKYDSIYSYSSSSLPEGMMPKEMDSLLNGVTQRFEKHFYSSTDGTIPDMFIEDSLFSEDIFADFFGDENSNSSEMMKKMQQKMQARMEAMRAQMQGGTPIIPAVPQEKNKDNKIE